MALTRVVSLAEGRLIEAMTGERMPRRPVHLNKATGFWSRIGNMLKDPRTWTTLAYLMLMLPLGIVYFVIAVVGLSVSLALIFAPLAEFAGRFGWFGLPDDVHMNPAWLDSLWALPLVVPDVCMPCTRKPCWLRRRRRSFLSERQRAAQRIRPVPGTMRPYRRSGWFALERATPPPAGSSARR